MSLLLNKLRSVGESLRALSNDAAAAKIEQIKAANAQNGLSKEELAALEIECSFADSWVGAGGVVYELTHDIAAMFAMTSAPSVGWERLPHDAFIIKIPRSLFPIPYEHIKETHDTWICVWQASQFAFVVPDADTAPVVMLDYGVGVDYERQDVREAVLCNRFLANTVAYVTQHRECVRPKGITKHSKSIFAVRPPRDVFITKQFRDAAIATVASSNLSSVRRALAHVVRGHWRNQPVGPARSERRLIWIHPHCRGDESLGRVVQRIESMQAKDES